jgi:arylsulfatase A-like enzyme
MDATRRDFVKRAVTAAMLTGIPETGSAAQPAETASKARPNVVVYCSDQFRWDFVGGYGLNPTVRTPNLDKMMGRGVTFTGAVSNQPLCSPARSCMMTGMYASEAGMWKLPPGTQMKRDLPTLASVFRAQGYTANVVGKWHLAPISKEFYDRDQGFVHEEDRGGFLDLWEAANVPELTSHPYEGTYWHGDGSPLKFKDEYRVDFVTDRAVLFLKQPQEKPFLLFISQVEPHHQNDMERVVAPNGYADRYKNCFVPDDLRNLPGDWQQELPDYYGCVESIDESVGRVLQTLKEQNLLDNTIFLFVSDHGCQFRTRNREYKRSPQDSSIRVPFILQGPGFDLSMQLPQITSLIDLAPTLIDGAGLQVPASMRGKSLVPLLHDSEARRNWKDAAFIQISESMVARAIRTKDWTYCVADPTAKGFEVPYSLHYQEYQMYNNASDPAQLVNLAGRAPFVKQAEELRAQLLQMIIDSGDPLPQISPAPLYP